MMDEEQLKPRLYANLIYCEDTHSLIHRLWMKWKKDFPKNKLDAQQDGIKTINEVFKDLLEKFKEKQND